MDKSLATLVKMLANDYASRIERDRFNGLLPKSLHMRSLRQASDAVIDVSPKYPDSKNS